jgi:hypothetical protein
MASKKNKASSQARDTKVIAAIASHFNGVATITLGGNDYKAKELQQLLQSRVDAAAASDAARATWLTAVAAEVEKTQEVESVLVDLRSHLVATHGAKSQLVADFGFTPKPRKVTAKTAAAAVDKRNATRAARHTMGSNQKAEITGDVPVVVAPPAPAPVANGNVPKATGAS